MNFNEDQHSPEGPFPNQRSLDILENKLDFLINLNLTSLKLIISLSSSLSGSANISDELRMELKTIHSALPNLLTLKDSKPVFMDLVEKLDLKLTELVGTSDSDDPVAKIEERSPVVISNKETIQSFNRYESLIDKWGIIESIESLMNSYANLSNLAFPTFYLHGCKEIQRYSLTQDITNPNSHEIIQFPSLKIRDLIFKLLREAPAARLLQNLKKMFPLQSKIELNPSEEANIQDIVKKYISNTSDYLNGKHTLQDTIRISSSVLQQYNLGPGDLESRIPNVSFSVVKGIQKEFQLARGNDFKQFIYSETIVLIHRLNDAILRNDRYIVLLRRLK